MTTALHVVPIADLVEHVSGDDCLCGPTAKPIKADDGSWFTSAWPARRRSRAE